MRSLISVFRLECLKLRRTLALWGAILAPLVVVSMQTLIWIRRGYASETGADPWLSFYLNALSMWAVFMLPLLIALVAALVYHTDHAHHGWHRMYTLPVPRWTVPAAKIGVVFALLTVGMVVLMIGSVAGAKIASIINRGIGLTSPVPWGDIVARTAIVALASMLVVALQNAVSLRWSSVSVSLGLGIAGAFVALSAAGWEYGYCFPWLMALYTIHGSPEVVSWSVLLSVLAGTAVIAATLVYAGRRDPGLYQ